MLLILTFLLITYIGNAQTIVKVQDSTFIKLSNSSKIIVSNPSVNPIRKSRLIKVGDFSYTVPRDKDINDLTPEEAKVFLDECLEKSGFITK